MNDVTRYADMKDSGVEWLGQIPRHWGVKRLRYIGICQNGISKSGEFFGHGFPFVTYKDVYSSFILPNIPTGLIESTKEEQDIYSVKKGDIFFTRTSETVEEIAFSSICMESIKNSTFAGFLIRFRLITKDILPEFSKYYFFSGNNRNYFTKELNLVTRASLNQDLLKNMYVLIPSLDEQQNIASYLDDKCSKIDDIIAEARTSIEEYKKWKASVIYEAVTKGLDPHAEMKDEKFLASKETSCKWKVTKIKYVAKLDPYSDMSNIPEDIEISFVPMECIKNNKRIEKCSLKNNYNSSYSSFLNGDIVVAKVTPCFENGNIAIMENLKNGCGFGSSELFVLRPFNINTKFLFYYLQSYSFKEGAISIMTGTGGLKRVS